MGRDEEKKSEESVVSIDSVRVRIQLVCVFLFLVAIFLVVRFFDIQVLQRDHYLAAARKIYKKTVKVHGQRGEVYDRNGNLLLANSLTIDIICEPFKLKSDEERKRLAGILARFFPKHSYREHYLRLDKWSHIKGNDGKRLPNYYLVVKRKASLDETELFKKAVSPAGKKDKRQNLLRIFRFEPAPVRTYPKGVLLANILGYEDGSGEKTKPRIGIVSSFHKDMTPGEVENKYEQNPSGHPIIFADNKIDVPVNGKDIYLTIYEPVQAILEEELDAACEKWKPDGICAAVADPVTGEILAIAQRPTFNPSDRSTYKSEAVRMRFARDIYEPGSLAKPFSVLYALEKNLVQPQDMIDCEKGRWAEKKLTDSHAYDKLSVSEVIQKSSNIGTAKIAVMLGKQGVYQALRRFGFNSKSGLPFPDEQLGNLIPPQKWDSLAITRIPIGYSFNTTLLQLLRAYCGLANNGKVPALKLVYGIKDPVTGELHQVPQGKSVDSGADPVQLYKLIEMMISVTEKGGTARQAAIPGFQVAGKTGTSRKNIPAVKDPVTKKIIRKSYYAPGMYYASFAGFVPAHDARLVMVVTVDNPKGASYGGTVAAPVFRRTMERTLRYLNIQPTEPLLAPRKTAR